MLSLQIFTYETARVRISESRSQIEDTDFASGTSDKERLNVILQAAAVNRKVE